MEQLSKLAKTRIGWGELVLIGFSLAVSYALVECVYYLLAGFEPEPSNLSNTWIDRKAAAFDPTCLYRWSTGKSRIARIHHGQIVFDQIFTANNRGFISGHDYAYERPDGTKRIVVFGDSFTAGEYLPVPWPDRAQEILERSREPNAPRIELDSFAVDAGGLANWHHIFFQDIVPHYQFDAIIIASYPSDLSRAYTIFDADERSIRMGRFPAPPASIEDFRASFAPRLTPLISITDDGAIDRILRERGKHQWRAPPFGLYAARDIRRRIDFIMRGGDLDIDDKERFVAPDAPLGKEELIKRYPGEINRMFEILDHAKKAGVPVLLATIPSNAGAVEFSGSGGRGKNEFQRELESLAALYGFEYFDGYSVFKDVPPQKIMDDLWLKGDGHWNPAGSDRFADWMASFIRTAWGPRFAR
jgi:hypothetical protein